MKIAFFTETFLPKVDGIVTRLTKTIEFLTKNGDDVMVFCPEGCPDSYKGATIVGVAAMPLPCLLYTSPSPRDRQKSRMPSSA